MHQVVATVENMRCHRLERVCNLTICTDEIEAIQDLFSDHILNPSRQFGMQLEWHLRALGRS
jgi:hypothetical protein